MIIEASALDALRRKYRTLVSLRDARDCAIDRGWKAFPIDDALPRRHAMQRLAAEFPGALRELDHCSLDALHIRLGAVERACAGEEVEAWIPLTALFHRALREALAIRGGRAGPFEFWTPDRLVPPRAAIARPPSGRLLEVVWEALAIESGLTRREVEQLVYPPRA